MYISYKQMFPQKPEMKHRLTNQIREFYNAVVHANVTEGVHLIIWRSRVRNTVHGLTREQNWQCSVWVGGLAYSLSPINHSEQWVVMSICELLLVEGGGMCFPPSVLSCPVKKGQI